MSIAHIVNPVYTLPTSRFHFIRMVTFTSILAAQSQATGDVKLYSAQFPEDHPLVPAEFEKTTDLTRSIQDIGQFTDKHKLPFIKDILDRLYQASQADYLVYTNVDIGLMPGFYGFIQNLVQQGHQAFTINRRTISDQYSSIDQLPQMYAEIGEPHRGWDCFVFKRTLYPRFILGELCLGAPMIGLGLIANLIAFAENFQQVTDKHVTFHLGNDRKWRGKNPIADHNKVQATLILTQLEKAIGGFPKNSPPGIYLLNQHNRVRGFLYEKTRSFYIPAKWTRRIK